MLLIAVHWLMKACRCQFDSVLLVQALTEDELMTVLRDPKNALCKQYKTMFKMDSAELRVTTGALRAIAREAVSRGTGARGLRSIMERLLRDAQFEVGKVCTGCMPISVPQRARSAVMMQCSSIHLRPICHASCGPSTSLPFK